jgi:hypothetical protein
MTRHHALFLRQADARYALPGNLEKVKSLLRRELQKQESLALEIAKAADTPKRNTSLLNELHRQKGATDLKIETLRDKISLAAFLEGWDEGAPRSTEPPARSPAAAPKRLKRRSRRRSKTEREKVIRRAIQSEKKGLAYMVYLDEHGQSTDERWQKDIDNPCPTTHVMAYKNEHWRQAIYREKSRLAKRMKRK